MNEFIQNIRMNPPQALLVVRRAVRRSLIQFAFGIFSALAISACAMPQEQPFVGDGRASTVYVTANQTIPGKSYRVLGPVSIDPGAPSMFNRLGESCDNPLNLAKAAIAKYGNPDAIVDYRTQPGACTVGICSSTCQGSAVVFVEAPAPTASKNPTTGTQAPAKPFHSAVNSNTEWPESEFGTY